MLLFPILIITVGITVIFSKNRKIKLNKLNDKYKVIFGNEEKIVDTVEDIDALSVFGNLELDLTNLKLDKDITINTNAIFGRVFIALPDDVNLVVEKEGCILGNSESKYISSANVKAKQIVIHTYAVLGEIEIK